LSRKLLEKKYSIQGIQQQQEGGKSNKIKNLGGDKEQSLVQDGSRISKMVQSIQIGPKTEWRPQAGNRHKRSKSIYEIDLFQDERNSDFRKINDEK
jgi:hypothetical protein